MSHVSIGVASCARVSPSEEDFTHVSTLVVHRSTLQGQRRVQGVHQLEVENTFRDVNPEALEDYVATGIQREATFETIDNYFWPL
jgi:hypothetical protein